jgi:hypothetical protein
MSVSFDDEFAALVATLPELPPEPPEPDWSEHPVYAELVLPAERLIQLLDLPPAARPSGRSRWSTLSRSPRPPMDQKRADLLVDAVLSGLPHDALPELQGRRPSIQIVVSTDTLLGLDDEPADLAGYGPITAETARRYAADVSGTWRRLLTDPDTGALLDIGKDSYRPGAAAA